MSDKFEHLMDRMVDDIETDVKDHSLSEVDVSVDEFTGLLLPFVKQYLTEKTGMKPEQISLRDVVALLSSVIGSYISFEQRNSNDDIESLIIKLIQENRRACDMASAHHKQSH